MAQFLKRKILIGYLTLKVLNVNQAKKKVH